MNTSDLDDENFKIFYIDKIMQSEVIRKYLYKNCEKCGESYYFSISHNCDVFDKFDFLKDLK